MEWYYVCWPWLTTKCVVHVCQHQLSFLSDDVKSKDGFTNEDKILFKVLRQDKVYIAKKSEVISQQAMDTFSTRPTAA